jgi:hypothetical protein
MTADLTLSDVAAGQALPELSHDVTATTVVLGALASRDWRPMHHDHDFAVNRNGTRDIFINTPNLAAWFERYITDWTGPRGRLGQVRFRMKDSIFPGDEMVFGGEVEAVSTDSTGCGWATLELHVRQRVPRPGRPAGRRGRQPLVQNRHRLEPGRGGGLVTPFRQGRRCDAHQPTQHHRRHPIGEAGNRERNDVSP